MKIIFSDQNIESELKLTERSVFLAGPTPRSKDVPSWRPDALDILREWKWEGQVIVPERQYKGGKVDYDDQVEWEFYGTEHCDRIVFWIPRVMATMPALTTNVEFGHYVRSGKSFYGRPEGAFRTRYLDWLYAKFNQHDIYDNLRELLLNACNF